MGRHSAADGASRQGDIGWPAPPRKGEGLGWPGDLDESAHDPAEPAPDGRRPAGISSAA
ncbi:hypothetical protein ACI797_21640 [Geodermatophilus sp. SYSU D00691]